MYCAGRLNGELKLHCHDAATWRFPSFSGKVACRGLDFHFWDAVDDLSRTHIDLVFDHQRLYMHNASGLFGSVPLTLSGDSASPVMCCLTAELPLACRCGLTNLREAVLSCVHASSRASLISPYTATAWGKQVDKLLVVWLPRMSSSSHFLYCPGSSRWNRRFYSADDTSSRLN